MARSSPTLIEFSVGDDEAVVSAMDELATRHAGWINLLAESDPDDEPPARSGLSTLLLAGPVHDVPTCTWVAGKIGRTGLQRDQVGIQHAVGTRVLGRLREEIGPLPDGWTLKQDHPRRGLVVEPSPNEAHGAVLAWMLEAGMLLSTVRLTGAWQAAIHRPA